jgi:acetyltransferase
MIVNELISPNSIVVVGGSNDVEKPGGKVIKNLLDTGFAGKLFVVNPKETEVQGIVCNQNVDQLGNVDLAIIAIASKFVLETVDILSKRKNTRAFIILSAGFSEMGEEGKKLEEKVVSVINDVNGTLIGPNCIGVLTPDYAGTFAGPVPKLDPAGVDFVTSSGATAAFILENAINMGLRFSSLFSVGNCAQTGIEDILEYWDSTFGENSSKIKMIYVEQVANPEKFLFHCRSLINKGCRIAAVQAGTTDAGSRAVSSHTGALAGSDMAVDSLFKKAGIVRCYGREELVYVASIFTYKELTGDRLAIITHAGGPGVMLTDALSKGGLKVPQLNSSAAKELLTKLHHGASTANPIDIIATGGADHLGIVLDYVDNSFDEIDASVVIFGTTGLFDVSGVYDVLDEKIRTCRKPIYPVLPSIVLAKDAVKHFTDKGRAFFPDEVVFGEALSMIYKSWKNDSGYIPVQISLQDQSSNDKIWNMRNALLKKINVNNEGYLSPDDVRFLLQTIKIPIPAEVVVTDINDLSDAADRIGFPLVMKVVGHLHKSDIGGVKLGVMDEKEAISVGKELMSIDGVTGVLLQKMVQGNLELFVGVNREPGFGHLILCGLGGIFIEALKDFSYSLAPVPNNEAHVMISNLRTYPLIKGYRGKPGTDENIFADIIMKISDLCLALPEIQEMDINPLIADESSITAVDARIRI